MKLLLKFLQLRFVPMSADLGLLLLRLWLGLSMLVLHGWPKVIGFAEKSSGFIDPFGFGPKASYCLALVGEVGGSILLILGLFTRLGAALGAITMGIAFFIAHNAQLSGPGSGEMAFLFLGGYLALFLLGGGRFALDMKLPSEAAPHSR
jgi:putative oxidoreductase